jgi:predicted nucleic acid-binding protein
MNNSIANTTVISNFASIKRLDLLQQFKGKIYLSTHVLDEVKTGLHQGYTFYTDFEQVIFPFSPTGWLHLTGVYTEAEMRLLGELSETLHSGEASSLAIAYSRHWTFLSDDKAARAVSKRLQIPVSGTLGVLLYFIKHHRLGLDEANELLQQMKLNGYYSPISSLTEYLSPGRV